jgi:hypothetical protein
MWDSLIIVLLYRLDRDREAKASAIAREIEGTSSSAQAIELENGDEEEAFSAVQRPSDRGPGREDGGGKKIFLLESFLIVCEDAWCLLQGASTSRLPGVSRLAATVVATKAQGRSRGCISRGIQLRQQPQRLRPWVMATGIAATRMTPAVEEVAPANRPLMVADVAVQLTATLTIKRVAASVGTSLITALRRRNEDTRRQGKLLRRRPGMRGKRLWRLGISHRRPLQAAVDNQLRRHPR